MNDETISIKEQYYDLKKYKDEVAQFVVKKRLDLDVLSKMQSQYTALRDVIFAGGTTSDKERFPHAAEMFKIYKSAIIASSLEGYSALVEINGLDAYSELKVPELKKVMTEQFKSMSLLEKLSADTVDDWILKGEAVSFIKLRTNKEEYRMKETLVDQETGEPVIKFTMKEVVSYDDIMIERIDPLDFYVDAVDYANDPRGCAKIVRSWISSKTLLTSDAYPLLSQQDKDDIISGAGRNGSKSYFNWAQQSVTSESTRNKTNRDNIEVLTYYGDYITSDNKVLVNIKATVIGNRIADIRYSGVSTNRIIYAAYKVDDMTHRSISPIAVAKPVNTLVNRVVDLFIQNLEDISDPLMLVEKGSITFQQSESARTKKFLEYVPVDGQPPQFWTPPVANMGGLQLIDTILNQNKNVLGLNNYLAGNTDGSVRTAEESSILFRGANTRMRVETDAFNYNYMLSLFVAFYAFNRELALAIEKPLNPIYSDEKLKVSISTNASRADREGEFNRLMTMLNLPLTQMIFSNLQPEQVILAVRYLMAKAGLTDADNILELVENSAPEGAIEPPPDMAMGPQGQIGMEGGQMLPTEPSMVSENIPTDRSINDIINPNEIV
ncbi:MAG: hypothetical protein NC218_08395 [Acetobacter sp.]|nr:hypothetical protein [Acetobacter sp.]